MFSQWFGFILVFFVVLPRSSLSHTLSLSPPSLSPSLSSPHSISLSFALYCAHSLILWSHILDPIKYRLYRNQAQIIRIHFGWSCFDHNFNSNNLPLTFAKMCKPIEIFTVKHVTETTKWKCIRGSAYLLEPVKWATFRAVCCCFCWIALVLLPVSLVVCL